MTWLQDYAQLFDAALALLLLITIAYAAVLNRKLTALRSAKDELQSLFGELTSATQAAEQSLTALKAAAEQTAGALQEQKNSAQAVFDDLAFLTKRGESLADRLEGGLARVREDPAATARPRSTFGKLTQAAAAAQTAPRAAGGGAEPGPRTGASAEGRATVRRESRPEGKRPLSSAQSDLLKALQGIR